MKKTSEKKDARKPSASFVIGAIALVFLIIGYQIALFIHHAAVTRIVAHHDRPDTVFIVAGKDSLPPPAHSGNPSIGESKGTTGPTQYRRDAEHSPAARQIRLQYTPRRYECFRFDPNTVSIEDLMRLGFSLKQAQTIDNYRQKGGRFRRKSDFSKSFVVADSVYRRLAPYIDIPAINLNTADSAAFETLPGIGKYFAARMVSYREELGGYSYPEQLMDIRHFDQEKFDGLKDLVTLGEQKPYPLWTLPEERLRTHPYIGKYAARGIVLFRENNPRDRWSVENLIGAGILDPELAPKLARCRIADP